jgi:2-polyprenyl-3-methyl-5-hydroxy-6-metoxy-1,4-benzoquinol methylase
MPEIKYRNDILICPLCDSKHTMPHLSFENNIYKMCKNCSLVFLGNKNSYPDDKALYNLEYVQKRGYDALTSSVARAKSATADYYLSCLEKYGVEKENFLEIGCATGIVLKKAQSRGWNTYGVEINEAAASIARVSLGTENIKTGYFNNNLFPDNFFSAVAMFDVLEHIRQPVPFIELLEKKMKPSGLLCILTPNIFSLSARVLRRKWPHLFPEHVCFYSPRSIKFLLEKHKFKILKIGWALKFVTIDIVRNHLNCHRHLFLAKSTSDFLLKLKIVDNIVFPFNIGEMIIVARK